MVPDPCHGRCDSTRRNTSKIECKQLFAPRETQLRLPLSGGKPTSHATPVRRSDLRPRYNPRVASVESLLTRVTLFVPGAPATLADWNQALARRGLRLHDGHLQGDGIDVTVEAQWIANDGAFGQAFSFGTVEPDIVGTIDRAPGALVLHWPIDLREGRTKIVATVAHLQAAGAHAVRLEQSKLGWEATRWLELFSSSDPAAWHRGAVMYLGSDGALQSCGMHAFSLPDVRIELDGDAPELQELAEQLNRYQLAEDPVIRSGQTFAPDRETPRRRVERWPDAEYPTDHSCHNPYGVWRVGPAGTTARSLPDLVPVFMPTLHALLRALEQQHGPLTKQQVESVRDGGACIAMSPRDAQHVERSRGYADFEPELAWEQWQLVREVTESR